VSDFGIHTSHILIMNKRCVTGSVDILLVSRPPATILGVKGSLIVTLHSYKGRTGKTLLSVNLAMIFADNGKKVCLLDFDLRAPSLSSTFNNNNKCWVNDYLNKSCKV